MDPITNPFAPGAGTQPPELAGRDALRRSIDIAVKRIRGGSAAKSMIMVGLRGVGKTVLLNRMSIDCDAAGFATLRAEAPEDKSLPAVLAPHLRRTLLGLSRFDGAKSLAERALRGLAGFAKALKVKYKDIEVALDWEPEPGLADNGDLETDLQALFAITGEAAKRANSALVMFLDELQYVAEDQLAALITALHEISQRNLPVTLVGAGLPQLRGRLGNAKSYAERLFDFPTVDALPPEPAKDAIRKPIRQRGQDIDDDALDLIVGQTRGYPYFLQEWGKHAWDTASQSPITRADVEQASDSAIAALDANFFQMRFDRSTPSERRYLRAMAELGPGPHRSGDIADILDRPVTSQGPTRSQLISKGMIWSPSHGDTAFTVPLFDAYMRRIMPGDDWRA